MAVATPEEIRSKVRDAREAQRRWVQLSFRERSRPILKFHDFLLERRDQILDTIQGETGKSRRDAFAEVVSVAGTCRYYLARGGRHLAVSRRRAAVPLLTAAEVVYKPHGVVGLITPWNYPFLLSVADALPALLAGNAVVVKPSELTPLSAEWACRLLAESGLDARLMAAVYGAADAGAELIRHVDYVGFTGGTATGRKVAVAAAGRLIPYSLELGGKNPMVVLQGAPIDEAATGLLAGAFSNSGQTCISIERVYVQQSVYDEFARRLSEKARGLKLGWSKGWDVDVGSMISREHAEKVLLQVERAVKAGARVLTGGGKRPELGPAFVEPTVLANVDDSMPISREETFGPVVALYPVRDAEEAIARANDSEFGLNATVWAAGGEQGKRVARRLETGSAVLNSTLLIYNTFDVPMGGVKASGIGRRHGAPGILRYTEAQSIVSSAALGGGFDALMMRIKNEGRASALAAILKLWRKLGRLAS